MLMRSRIAAGIVSGTLLIGLLGRPLLAQNDSACPPLEPARAIDHNGIDSLLREVVTRSFPELSRTEILLYELRSRSDFFTSGLDYTTLLGSGANRVYLIFVNPRLFAGPPSPDAIRAVLAHELSHVVDYSRKSAPALTKFLGEYLTRPTAAYERETDRHALERGYACGLEAYRRWLYGEVSASAAEKKRQTYLTPDEIEEWRRTGR